jgi:hypothetical protein
MGTNAFNFKIDDKNQVIIYKHDGLLKLEDIGDAWQVLVKHDEFVNKGYNLLCDYSDADFDFSLSKTQLAWDYLFSIKDILNNKKEAVITSTPTSTAISILFEKETMNKLNFSVKTFATYSAAISWLQEK